MRRTVVATWLMLIAGPIEPGLAHDIPNARVDRSIQATLGPSRLRVDYEVSLAELTLIQDLRQLGGEVESAGGDRRAWFEHYAKVVAPLNARGFLVTVDGNEVDLRVVGSDLAIEGHPRFTFHFEANIPAGGRLSLNDINYQASEGTSRLALRPVEGVEVRGDSLPVDVAQVAIRPVWQLGDAEERRTRRMVVDYALATKPQVVAVVELSSPTPRPEPSTTSGLTRLLDGATDRAWPALLLGALVLGAAHAIQPGHGKTLVAASSLGEGWGPLRGAGLGLATATAHMGSVALIAAILWATRSTRSAEIHQTLARLAGFAIASIGFWRFGRHLAGHGEHDRGGAGLAPPLRRGFLALALAGGIVPCWDAVALVIAAESLGRLPLGLALLAAFSLGMAGVLVLVGLAAGRFRATFSRAGEGDRWGRRFGLLGSTILVAIGLAMIAG